MSTIPPKGVGEDFRSYYRRLSELRATLRAYLPQLREDAVQVGLDRGMSMRQIAAAMGVSPGWLSTPRKKSVSYDESLVPPMVGGEDSLEYYVHLLHLRDSISSSLPRVAASAVEEAERTCPQMNRSAIAVDMGISERFLSKQARIGRE